MKVKGSIAVFAVAAAFAGSVAAETIKVADCQALLGYDAFKQSWDGKTGTGIGAWLTVANSTSSFTGGKTVTCSVPKNRKESYDLGTMTNDQCGMFGALASADGKVAAAKLFDAQSVLASMQSKLSTLYTYGKLDKTGYDAISGDVGKAQTCVNLLISGQ
jgi:hypothetical protein